MTGSNSQTVAGLTTPEEQLNKTLVSVLLEFSPASQSAGNNLTWFNFLLDQVLAKVPNIHPMQVAQELYMRLTPSSDWKAISDAFQMGTLVASSLRNHSREHNEKMAKELKQATKEMPNWIINTSGNAPK